MFGLFSSKTKKIEEKLSNLAIEIASIQKNIIIYPNENNYKNLHISKTKELNSLYNDSKQPKEKIILMNLLANYLMNIRNLNMSYLKQSRKF